MLKIDLKQDHICSVNAITYHQALTQACKEMGSLKLQVELPPLDVLIQEQRKGARFFLSYDGLAGAYVLSDGYMGGLFKSPYSPFSSVSKALQDVRIIFGGRYFDAYATKLESIYINNGFKPVARVAFNEEFAPAGWDAEDSPLKDKPDVVFFVFNSDKETDKEHIKVGDGFYFTTYQDAKKYVLTKLNKNHA